MKVNLWPLMALGLAAIAACSFKTEAPQGTKPVSTGISSPQPKAATGSQPEGKILFTKKNTVWIWQNGNAKPLASNSAYENPSWSPDGKSIAAVLRSNSYSDLVVLSDNGKLERQLTRFGPTPRPTDSSWARRPAWSPDGSKIAFAADAGSYRFGIWTVAAGGGSLARANYRALGDGDADSPSWSPDGKTIAIAAFWEPASQIYLLNQSTGVAKKVTNHQQGAYDPYWSPDGKRIAYTARTEGNNDIWVMDSDGANAVEVTTTGTARSPVWSADSQALAFLGNQNEVFELFVVKVPVTAGGASRSYDVKQVTKGLSIDAAAGLSWTR